MSHIGRQQDMHRLEIQHQLDAYERVKRSRLHDSTSGLFNPPYKMFCKLIPTYTEFWNTGPLEDMVWKTWAQERLPSFTYLYPRVSTAEQVSLEKDHYPRAVQTQPWHLPRGLPYTTNRCVLYRTHTVVSPITHLARVNEIKRLPNYQGI